MQTRLQIEGIAALRTQLMRLPVHAIPRVIGPALLVAARVIAAEVRKRAPKGKTRNLRRAVTTRTPRRNVTAEIFAEIGFKRGRGRHAHLVEKGTANRHTKRGANRGAMPANQFFSSAVSAKASAALDALRISWASRLAIEARRLKIGGPR